MIEDRSATSKMNFRRMPNIGELLKEHEKKRRPGKTVRETARAIGIAIATYCDIRNGKRAPTFPQILRMARYFDLPCEAFLPPEWHVFAHQRDGLHWRLRPGLESPSQLVIRDATHLALDGHAPEEILKLVASDDGTSPHVDGTTLVQAVRAGVGLGLAELLLSPSAGEIQDSALAGDLAAALSSVAPSGAQVQVHVVRNFVHRTFQRDPLVPFLIAHVAHRVVGTFFRNHPQTYTLGIAGGIHVASFVGLVGADSSPFPEDGNRQFTLVPLTVEPFDEHRFDLADTLVGQLYSRAAMLLGHRRLNAHSCQPFGYVVDGQIGELDKQSIIVMRSQYRKLDVAIFGCGDKSIDGWMGWARRAGDKGFDPLPATDVCLNPISGDGTPIPLPDSGGLRCEHLGVAIEDIRSMTSDHGKLALLLASGTSKGLPITLVVRAGCANTVVCDQAAARAALTTLRP